jgi:hypothetical protein
VIDASQKALGKIKKNVENCNDEDKLQEVVKKLKYLEGIVGPKERASAGEYSI